MLQRLALVALALAVFPHRAAAQSNPETKPTGIVLIKAARVLDVRSGHYIENAAVLIEGDRIKEVGPMKDLQARTPKSAKIIDLPGATLLPGLIDSHTHLMAHMASGPDGYILDLATKSQAFRALEGAADASPCMPASPPFATSKTKVPATPMWRFATPSIKDSSRARACR
jgi:hypothetical protein